MISLNQLHLLLLILLLNFITVKGQNYCGSYNCYQLLGVSSDADETTIRKAYRQMAKKYHPDKNKQKDTTQIFQMINKAVQILTDDKSRFKYNLHLQNPHESDYYHEYRYYKHHIIEDPKIHPGIVVGGLISLVSLLQYVMRKQMYESAIYNISEGHDFKTKVNERCGKDKKKREKVREQMIQEISIEGGYSKPELKDILIWKIIILPYTLLIWGKGMTRWAYKYWIKRQPYTLEDKIWLTIKALKLTPARWQTIHPQDQQMFIKRELWIKQNMIDYNQERKQEYLEQLKADKPHQYAMMMKYLKKHQ